MKPLIALGLAGAIALLSGFSVPALSQESRTVQEANVGEVTAVAKTFLAALSAADTATLSTLLATQAMIYSVREGDAGSAMAAVTREAFLESLGGEERELLERMWEPKVLVQDRVGMVWTPYDFHLNGRFSHCGIDVFTMLRGEEGWQVTNITYNVVREGCPPSPLGPPGRSGT
jgi:hypothetical protein